MNRIFAALLLSLSTGLSYCYQSLISLQERGTRGANGPLEIIANHIQDKAVVLFYKPGCPYCVYLIDTFKALAVKNQDKAQFIMVDIQQRDQPYKSAYRFSTVPTVIYFKNGQALKSHGSNNKTITLSAMQNNVKLLA